MKAEIQTVIKKLMDKVLEQVLNEDRLSKNNYRSENPLYAALVPDEIFKGSHFEKCFVAHFKEVWESLVLVAANKGLGYGVAQHEIIGNISQERLRRIAEILNRLEHGQVSERRVKPDWNAELSYVLQDQSVPLIPVKIICDVYAQNIETGEAYAFELEALLPNNKQTKASKEKLLKLYSMYPLQITGAYYALPYNSYETRENYSWSFPARWFDMKRDEVILIGDEFWEKIGGSGTYQAFVEALNEVGSEYKQRIYVEYLGINPPEDNDWML
ncbi:MAG: TdeIII family type II restriction endonuclease [Oculatellaceae cyanobacterium bins.114]|nr:TdeIII family type II restriction endonuclease [Oculatellaceae cyanobacterium bins.114]